MRPCGSTHTSACGLSSLATCAFAISAGHHSALLQQDGPIPAEASLGMADLAGSGSPTFSARKPTLTGRAGRIAMAPRPTTNAPTSVSVYRDDRWGRPARLTPTPAVTRHALCGHCRRKPSLSASLSPRAPAPVSMHGAHRLQTHCLLRRRGGTRHRHPIHARPPPLPGIARWQRCDHQTPGA